MMISDLLKPGIPAVIQIKGYSSLKLTTFVRGFKDKIYIIVDHPLHNGRPLNISEDTKCIVRFIHEGKVIGFRTIVLAAVKNPANLVFLRFPTSYETSSLRKFDRYPIKISAVCAPRRLNGDIESMPRILMLNLSKGGCLVESPEPYSLGVLIYLTVFLPEQGQINDVEAEVKRCEKGEEKYYLGLSFADLLDPSYEQIKGYLHLLESYQVRA